ncbi:MAG TPA: hypothetical protein VN642_19715, partial [Dongiaceae bacterium]|nr:hypothetical protein [Dongiaceae bacterium]
MDRHAGRRLLPKVLQSPEHRHEHEQEEERADPPARAVDRPIRYALRALLSSEQDHHAPDGDGA